MRRWRWVRTPLAACRLHETRAVVGAQLAADGSYSSSAVFVVNLDVDAGSDESS